MFYLELIFEYDYVFMNLIEEFLVKGKLFCLFCQLWLEQKEVVLKCLICNELLCDVCSGLRYIFIILIVNYKVVFYKDFLVGKYEVESLSIVCNKYFGMSFEFYCWECWIFFCKECFYFEYRVYDYVNVLLVKIGIEREIEKVLENLSKISDELK